MLLYKKIESGNDYMKLQHDIDQLNCWTMENNLAFNVNICKYIVILRKQTSFEHPLHLGSTRLEKVHLQISWRIDFIQSHLVRPHTLNMHESLIGLLYQHFFRNTNGMTLFKLYVALVRPHMEYVSPVWNPHVKTQIKELE